MAVQLTFPQNRRAGHLQGSASLPLWISHITLVSVTTEANVPIRTATEAGSTQVLFCRAMTNTFSAGGSDAIKTAVAAHGCANGPNSSINPNTSSGWISSFTAITPGTSQGTRSNGRNATVTPSTNSAVGAAAFCRNVSVLSIATGGRKCSAAASAPAPADMISGLSTICRTTMPNVCSSERCSRSVNAINIGTIENRKMLSQQKINAVGADALVPSTASASPGPM